VGVLGWNICVKLFDAFGFRRGACMRLTGLGLFFSVLLLVGCGGDDGGTPPVSTEPMGDGGNDNRGCVDEDDDGAGRRCPVFDCDDDDPEVTDDCMRCQEPAENCPCDEGAEAMLCTPKNINEQKEEHGQLLQCTEGQRYCREAVGVDEETFVWTDCVGVFTPVLN
jgi:hypothetical protein